MASLAVYRAPAEGLVVEPMLVKMDPWRCRMFGHRLHGRFVREPRGTFEYEQSALHGARFYDCSEYPSERVPPSHFVQVWCLRCGREWKRAMMEEFAT